MTIKQAYITALTDTLLKDIEIDSVLKSTKQLLIKKGHGRLWSAVLNGTLLELERRNNLNTPQVTVANITTEKNERLIKALEMIGAEVSTTYQVSVDDTIIGGFIVRYRDRIFDASYKRVLIDLYRKVAKS